VAKPDQVIVTEGTMARLEGKVAAEKLDAVKVKDTKPKSSPSSMCFASCRRNSSCLGDNRGRSYDGRSFGFVESSAILGRARAIYWRSGAPVWIADL